MTPEQAQEFECLFKNKPHVVIIGAGATVATVADGDRRGRKFSVGDGFVEKLGMGQGSQSETLKSCNTNLEEICTELRERTDCEQIHFESDEKIKDYFSGLEISENPNIYDFLLLSLRKKDLIATFTWDPLLIEAYQRVCSLTKDLPDIGFFHGNILVGYCRDHTQSGIITTRNEEYGNFEPAPIFPVAQKKYIQELCVHDNWQALRNKIQRAYLLTVFGCGAPKTDGKAIALLKNAQGSIDERNLEHIEFIGARREEDLLANWADFLHSHTCEVHNNFFSSSLGKYPRRTTVEFFDRTMNCMFTDALQKFEPSMGWDELSEIIQNLVNEEEQVAEGEFLTTKLTA